MYSTILAWILSLQMLLSMLIPAPPLSVQSGSPAQETCLFWGLIDPELSLWFSRIPQESRHTDKRLHWDFTWRGFLAALMHQPIIKEDPAHAPQV